MTVKFQGNNVTLIGKELKVGDKLDNFVVVDNSLNEVSLDSLKGKKVFLTVPSLDTPVCDLEVKTFNKRASEIKDLAGIYTISLDLPFAVDGVVKTESKKLKLSQTTNIMNLQKLLVLI